MRLFRITIVATAVLASCLSASAQNLNPTVQVSRTYEGKLLEVTKPEMVMNVPDSLLKVKVDFDYDVFETPYRGAYEFTPYLMDMKPQADAFTGNNFYLRTGAGLLFNPELTAVYSPSLKGRTQLSVYGFHKSFWGPYKKLNPTFEDNLYKLTTKGTAKGHDMKNRFGVSGRVDWLTSILTFDLGYRGIAAKDTLMKSNYNALDLNLRMRSNDNSQSYFFYDATVGLSFASDKVNSTAPFSAFDNKVSENIVSLDATVGPVLDYYNRFIVDVSADVASYTGMLETHGGVLAVTPKYQFEKDRWKLSLGARLSAMIRGTQQTDENPTDCYTQKSQGLYPDAYVGYEAVYDKLILYSKLTGGEKMNTYTSLKEKDHFFNPLYGYYNSAPLLNTTVEGINVSVGVNGRLSENFQLDLKGGFKTVKSGLLESVVTIGDIVLPTSLYGKYSAAYSQLLFSWTPGDFFIEGDINYLHTNLNKKSGESSDPTINAVKNYTDAFSPASFTADLRVMYSWQSRISAGLWTSISSARKGYMSSYSGRLTTVSLGQVPGFVDLGLLAEYQFNRKTSFYLQAGNLLNSNIQRTAGRVESGINFTAGICLNF